MGKHGIPLVFHFSFYSFSYLHQPWLENIKTENSRMKQFFHFELNTVLSLMRKP